MDIEKKLRMVPVSPGVYLFRGEDDEIIYIGKASNLRSRIRSYFQKGYLPPKTKVLVSHIKGLDYITTSSSAEALIYEAGLIKEKKPRYNIELKDDKSYPYLKLATNERFPRLLITRGKKKDGALYYGPYTSVKLLRKAVAEINRLFLLRSCASMPKKPCLKAHIKHCAAPCNGSISEDEYKKIAEEAKLFLEGKREGLINYLSFRMREASRNLDYEKALILRDKIEAFSSIWKGRKAPPALYKEISQLKEALGLRVMPARIEAFDISNTHGKEAVGSMVSFFSGKPRKDEYKRFRIKYIKRIDDYAMIKEIVRRRYAHVLKEKGRFPDLILIDGGKGHLNAAKKELDKLDPFRIPVISIAKENEDIYVEGKKEPLRLSRRSAALKLIMRIRDEAHRFAITYHKLLRGKDLFRSVLDEIEGVGEKRKPALLEHFGSVRNIEKATIQEIEEVRGMNEKTAKKILQYFANCGK